MVFFVVLLSYNNNVCYIHHVCIKTKQFIRVLPIFTKGMVIVTVDYGSIHVNGAYKCESFCYPRRRAGCAPLNLNTDVRL